MSAGSAGGVSGGGRRSARCGGCARAARIAGVALAAALAACAGPSRTPPAPGDAPLGAAAAAPERVLLVTVAGLAPQHVLAPPGAAPAMPALARRAARGVVAEAMVPVVPAAAMPARASLATGRRPPSHGIVADHVLDGSGVRAVKHWHASRLEAPPLWDAVPRRRGTAAVLGWPTSAGSGADVLLPALETVRAEDTWLGLQRRVATPWVVGWLEERAPQEPRPAEPWPTAAERDELAAELACELAQRPEPPALWMLALDEPGRVLTERGPHAPEARAALGRADARLERILSCLEDAGLLASTTLVVAGDRPFAPVHTRVRPNAVLAEEGLVRRPDGTAQPGWEAIARSHGGSALVYAREEESAVRARRVLEDRAERTGAFRVVSATELQELGADPQAWFGLEASPGVLLEDGVAGPVLWPAEARGASGYLSPGAAGFVAWGAGLRPALRVPRLEQVDVAPTVALLLGLPAGALGAPGEVDGRPLWGILSPALLEARRERRGAGGAP